MLYLYILWDFLVMFFWGVVFPCVAIGVIFGFLYAGIVMSARGIVRLFTRKPEGWESLALGGIALGIGLVMGWYFWLFRNSRT